MANDIALNIFVNGNAWIMATLLQNLMPSILDIDCHHWLKEIVMPVSPFNRGNLASGTEEWKGSSWLISKQCFYQHILLQNNTDLCALSYLQQPQRACGRDGNRWGNWTMWHLLNASGRWVWKGDEGITNQTPPTPTSQPLPPPSPPTHPTPHHPLTHWGRDKMAVISQTTLSNPFYWMKIFEFRLKCHWSLFFRFQLTIFHHWFR